MRPLHLLSVTITATALALPASAAAADCPNEAAVKVPGAEMQKAACLDDLTTAGTSASGHTDPSDWAGLNAAGAKNPSGVPGLQVDGYFPDSSTFNTENGWNHDAQFVIRFPNEWNGKLVITGAPGIRKQYAPDFVIGDWAVAQGYAYASTDKGNSGAQFFQDGSQPGDAVAEWNARVTELTRAAKLATAQRYGSAPKRTYMTGISNGGYLTRWQLENHPELYDGGVDWEGTLFTASGPNLFTYLPAALKNYPHYKATGDPAAHDAMIAAGFQPGSEILWDDHYGEYWDLTQRTYREEFDPGYDGDLQAGVAFCQSGLPSCDADYDYASRPQAVKDAVGKVALHGRIGKPMLTLHGTLDALLPIRTDSDVYSRMVSSAGKAGLHRYYVIEHGNHVDGRYDAHPDALRPILPCYRTAFTALTRWVEHGSAPPPSQFVPDDRSHDTVNACALAAAGAPGTGPSTAIAARVKPRGLTLHVTRRHLASGRLLLPKGLTAATACGSGTVRVRARTVRLGARCRYRARLHVRKGRHPALVVRARFSGNRALKPIASRRRLVG